MFEYAKAKLKAAKMNAGALITLEKELIKIGEKHKKLKKLQDNAKNDAKLMSALKDVGSSLVGYEKSVEECKKTVKGFKLGASEDKFFKEFEKFQKDYKADRDKVNKTYLAYKSSKSEAVKLIQKSPEKSALSKFSDWMNEDHYVLRAMGDYLLELADIKR